MIFGVRSADNIDEFIKEVNGKLKDDTNLFRNPFKDSYAFKAEPGVYVFNFKVLYPDFALIFPIIGSVIGVLTNAVVWPLIGLAIWGAAAWPKTKYSFYLMLRRGLRKKYGKKASVGLLREGELKEVLCRVATRRVKLPEKEAHKQ